MLLGGWCLNEQEGTKRCCSPACWSWSRSAAGHDSVGQSCSSVKTAREKETASEKAKSMVSGVGGRLMPHYQRWTHLHVKNKQKRHPINSHI